MISWLPYLAKNKYELVAKREFNIRMYMPWELRKLLHNYGLKPIKFLGDYNGNEFNVRSPRMIIIAIKE